MTPKEFNGCVVLEAISLGSQLVLRLNNSSIVAVTRDNPEDAKQRLYLPPDEHWLRFLRTAAAEAK